MDANAPIRGKWACIELMGYLKLYGLLTEESHFGEVLGRVDVPTSDEPDAFTTEYFGGKSIYRVRLVDEQTARDGAGYRQPRYQLPPGRVGTPADVSPYYDDKIADGVEDAEFRPDDHPILSRAEGEAAYGDRWARRYADKDDPTDDDPTLGETDQERGERLAEQVADTKLEDGDLDAQDHPMLTAMEQAAKAASDAERDDDDVEKEMPF